MIPAVLQGRDCTDKGIIKQATAGSWGLALSRGLDSPAKKQDPNEDSCGVVVGTACSVAVVADAHFGRQSAELSVSALLSAAVRNPPAPGQAAMWLKSHLRDINRRAQPGSSACALLAVVLHADQLTWASIGDCRLYRLHDGHTRVCNRMNSRYLGDWGMLGLESGEETLQAGDRIIMASDGLPECRYGIPTLEPAEIGQIASEGAPSAAALALAEAALDGGGEDNIAVLLYTHTG